VACARFLVPLALKAFEVAEAQSFEELAAKLKGYGVLEREEVDG